MLDKVLSVLIEKVSDLGLRYQENILIDELPSTQIDDSFNVVIVSGSGDRKNQADFSIRAEAIISYYITNYAQDLQRMKSALVTVEEIIRTIASIETTDEIIKNINFQNFVVSFLEGSERVYKIDLTFEVLLKMQIK